MTNMRRKHVIRILVITSILTSAQLNVIFRTPVKSYPLESANCNFETECPAYKNDELATFNWIKGNLTTPSPYTGPEGDNTPGMNGLGNYLYIESSKRLNGDIARFKTHLIDNDIQDKKICVEFFYHMRGHTMGELAVLVDEIDREVVMFQLIGKQSTQGWNHGRFAMDTPSHPFKIIFQGKTSFSFYGDIAIDDIHLYSFSGKGCYSWPINSLPLPSQPPPPVPNNGPEDSSTCGKSKLNQNPDSKTFKSTNLARVVGGTKSTIGEWPWMAMILIKKFDGPFEPSCGGVLLGLDWIITAAHCVADVANKNDILVRLGVLERSKKLKQTQEFSISDVYVHPQYKTEKEYNNDVAMIKLKKPAMVNHFVESICILNNHKFSHGDQCFIAGWGKVWNDGIKPAPFSEILRHGMVTIRKTSECNDIYGERLTENMICAGDESGVPDTCLGDSGGPLMCQEDGQWILTGITSWGPEIGCGQSNMYGVYTNVKTVQNWIKSVIKYPDMHETLHLVN
ncbi:serine protease 55-like [Hydra vulgaris]|uniref:Serine protease 55-like n=1 Tax=Hydra vulgaris TaxID=6087 RepID=A0ABM4DPF7_HYDVU